MRFNGTRETIAHLQRDNQWVPSHSPPLLPPNITIPTSNGLQRWRGTEGLRFVPTRKLEADNISKCTNVEVMNPVNSSSPSNTLK